MNGQTLLGMQASSVVTTVAVITLGLSGGMTDANPSFLDRGKPSSKPLPAYCQMGECFVLTVEATDPVAFSAKGVLFRIESQNWHSKTGSLRDLRREANITSYVLCSKTVPAVIDAEDQREFRVTFLQPNVADSYDHSNETALALYFTVCHSRSFEKDLFSEGPAFAEALGYVTKERDDQPIVDSPERALEFLK